MTDRRPKRAGEQRGTRRTVYRRRRLIAVAVVSVLLGALAWGAVRLAGLVGDAWEAVAAADASAAPTTSATPQPVACRLDTLGWVLTPDAGAAGAPVVFGITVTNGSDVSCLVDGGSQALVLTVTSGEDQIWSNAHCGAAEAVPLLLGPGDSTGRTITWDGKRSAAGCAAVDAPVLPGTYQVGLVYTTVAVPEVNAVFQLY